MCFIFSTISEAFEGLVVSAEYLVAYWKTSALDHLLYDNKIYLFFYLEKNLICRAGAKEATASL